ncbi:hypothetical protein RD792_007359 [Penstemon davidsonii]|uniref:Pectinesterase n=1 Tax=Penstemon davidsonii TaxID=160366 RepID=A0ABR0D6Z1_9LAMI|nr:hypothetical protein RD792_007359 [Penstemon davidsonii]
MHVRGVERRVQDNVIVVDKNGRGDSVTVQGAVDMVPEQNTQRVKIQILPGIYSEKVHVPASKPYISFIGDPELAAQTVITWHDKASDRDINGGLIGTWNSSSVIVESDYFCASYITFQNTVVEPYGGLEGYQAVALRISGDKAVFHKVRFLGSQDTLLDESGSHLFYRCFIQGATDFIFGNAKSLYQECAISVVGPAFAIAAHHRNSENEDTGFSFVNCNVTGNGSVYLGRAWGSYSRIIYAYTEFNINVTVGGWQDWGSTSSDNTVVFGEYQCRGIGANRSGRVPYSKELNYIEAKPYLDRKFINEEQWLRF